MCPIAASAQSYPDMMANKVQFAFSSIAGALPFTTDNRVRPHRHHRHQALAGLSRSADGGRGRPEGLRGRSLARHLRAAGLPADVLTKLNGALQTTLKKPGLKTALAKVGVEPRGTSPERPRS